MTECFDNYFNYKIVESDNIIDFIQTEKGDCGIYAKNDIVLPLTKSEFENLEIIYDYPKFINGTFNKDTEIGLVKIYSQNNLIFSEKIYTIIGVE